MKGLPPLVAAAGAAFIFYQWAGARPFWVDEEMIAINIRDRSFGMLGGSLWLGQSAPLGWLVLQRAILTVAGTSEQALRFLPALFGAATLAAAAWVGWRWLTTIGALTLVLLCTFGLWLSFFPLELKHYSADAFWGLTLPALAAWVLDARDRNVARQRALAWWAAAILAHWLSNGGLLAAPGCVLLLFALIWRRFDAREALIFAAGGLMWLASFAVLYQLSLRYTHHSPYLRHYWSAEFPSASIGLAGLITWIAVRLPRLAWNPGGTSTWITLWVSAAAGFAFAARPALGMAFATAPLVAFALVAVGLVPLYERFSLWIVPALYAGIALLADRAARIASTVGGPRRWLRVATALLVAAAVIPVAGDIIARGLDDFRKARGPGTNHGLHDRDAVKWLLSQRRPGDAVISTRLGWPALWWYGPIPPNATVDGYEVDYRWPGSDCAVDPLHAAMKPHTRALVHIGFPDLPEGFGELLLRHLDRMGAIASYREFSHIGFVAVIDLHTPGAEQSSLDLVPRRQPEPKRLAGCIAIKPAALW